MHKYKKFKKCPNNYFKHLKNLLYCLNYHWLMIIIIIIILSYYFNPKNNYEK